MSYGFVAVGMGGLEQKVRELEESQKGMKKKITPKVINTIDR